MVTAAFASGAGDILTRSGPWDLFDDPLWPGDLHDEAGQTCTSTLQATPSGEGRGRAIPEGNFGPVRVGYALSGKLQLALQQALHLPTQPIHRA